MEAAVVAYEAVPKAVVYAAAMLAIGVAVMRGLVGRPAVHASAAGTVQRLEPHLRRAALAAAVAATLALAARVFAHSIAAFGSADAMRWESLRVVAIESAWGQSWQVQAFAAIGLLLTALLIRWLGPRGWLLYASAAAALSVTIPLLGHAAGSAPRTLLHAGHVTAAGAWLGTLGAIVIVGRRARAGEGTEPDPIRSIVQRFSPVALCAAGVVAATGAIAAVIYVAAPANLLQSVYGNVLALKLGAVAGVAACGRANWQRAKSGRGVRWPMLAAELAGALFVVIVTSLLTELEHP
jgi:putative copper export protein